MSDFLPLPLAGALLEIARLQCSVVEERDWQRAHGYPFTPLQTNYDVIQKLNKSREDPVAKASKRDSTDSIYL